MSLDYEWSGASLPKMLTHVGGILHREKETLKIHPIREHSETYLEGPRKSRIVDAHKINTIVK